MITYCAASPGHTINTDMDAYIVHGDTYRHVWCGDPTGRAHTLTDAPEPPFGTPPVLPLAVGDVLYGYCGGAFGRDSYSAKTVEAIGPDWVVAREGSRVVFAAGDPADLTEYRTFEENL